MRPLIVYAILLLCIVPIISCRAEPEEENGNDSEILSEESTSFGFDDLLTARRSTRDLSSETLDRETALELLWAGQGITDEASGKRTAPSAFATYYLSLLYCDETGVYEYDPVSDEMINSTADDMRPGLSAGAFGQKHVAKNGALIVITADMRNGESKFGENAERYIYIEAGHVAQNILLKATDLGLGSCPVGGFNTGETSDILMLKEGREAIYMIAIGYTG